MFKGSCLSVFLLASTAATGCMVDSIDDEGDLQDDVATIEAELAVGTSVRLGSFNNGCDPGRSPRVVFGGFDAQNRETYTVQGLTASVSAPSGGNCSDTVQLFLERGKKVRIKGFSIFGNAFRGGGATGIFTVNGGLRTARNYAVSTFLPQTSGTSFQKVDFSMGANDFSNCSPFPTPGETLSIRPQVAITGGNAGQTPSMTVSMSSLTVSLEVVSCIP